MKIQILRNVKVNAYSDVSNNPKQVELKLGSIYNVDHLKEYQVCIKINSFTIANIDLEDCEEI